MVCIVKILKTSDSINLYLQWREVLDWFRCCAFVLINLHFCCVFYSKAKLLTEAALYLIKSGCSLFTEYQIFTVVENIVSGEESTFSVHAIASLICLC